MWGLIFTSVADSVVTLDTTNYTPWPASAAFKGYGVSNDFIKVDPSDSTSFRFVVGNQGEGVHRCHIGSNLQSNQGNKTYHFSVCRNGSVIDHMITQSVVGATCSDYTVNRTGLIKLKCNDWVDFRVQSMSTGMELTMTHMIFGLQFVSSSTSYEVII